MVLGREAAVVSRSAAGTATVVPGLPPSGSSCSETTIFAAGGVLLFALGIVIVVQGRRAPEGDRRPPRSE